MRKPPNENSRLKTILYLCRMKRLTSLLLHTPVVALLWNLLVVYCAYTLCRAIFVAMNWSLYAGTLTMSHGVELFGAGLLFDTPAHLPAPLALQGAPRRLSGGAVDLRYR